MATERTENVEMIENNYGSELVFKWDGDTFKLPAGTHAVAELWPGRSGMGQAAFQRLSSVTKEDGTVESLAGKLRVFTSPALVTVTPLPQDSRKREGQTDESQARDGKKDVVPGSVPTPAAKPDGWPAGPANPQPAPEDPDHREPGRADPESQPGVEGPSGPANPQREHAGSRTTSGADRAHRDSSDDEVVIPKTSDYR